MITDYTRADWDAWCDWLRARTADRAGFESSAFTLVKVAESWMHENGHTNARMSYRKVIALSRSAGYEVKTGKSARGNQRHFVVGLALLPRA